MKKTTETAVQRIEGLKAQMEKEIGAVKVELAKQLAVACNTLEVLKNLGEEDVLADHQFSEYVSRLGISTSINKPVPTGKRTRRSSVSVSDAQILAELEKSPKNITKLATIFGCSNITMTKKLKDLVSRKKAVGTKEGTSVIYAAK